MKHIFKSVVAKVFNRKTRDNKIKDDENQLVFIHIGKCGGSSLWDAINNSSLVRKQFTRLHKVHMGKPPILEKSKYLIVIRNPISRAVSAFNWRYKLVVEDEVQRHRFEGEWKILSKYKTLNTMAEALYKNDELNEKVAREFQSIHHLKENIGFYLQDLLEHLTPEQLFGVLSTETLSEDVRHQLGVTSLKRTYENGKYVNNDKMYLSELAYENLRKYLLADYQCLEKLVGLKSLTVCDKKRLLQ